MKERLKGYDDAIMACLKENVDHEFKVGDMVLRYQWLTMGRPRLSIDKVEKITPTGQITLVKSPDRFKGNRKMGDHSWTGSTTLYPYNKAAVDLLNESNAVQKSAEIIEKNVALFTVDELKNLAEQLLSRGAK